MIHENKLRHFKVYGVCKTEKQEKYLGTIGLICTPLYGKMAAQKTFGGIATKIRIVEFNPNNA